MLAGGHSDFAWESNVRCQQWTTAVAETCRNRAQRVGYVNRAVCSADHDGSASGLLWTIFDAGGLRCANESWSSGGGGRRFRGDAHTRHVVFRMPKNAYKKGKPF